jgi:hypothetical protein
MNREELIIKTSNTIWSEVPTANITHNELDAIIDSYILPIFAEFIKEVKNPYQNCKSYQVEKKQKRITFEEARETILKQLKGEEYISCGSGE